MLTHAYGPGSTIDGRYLLTLCIGSGGAGEVWRAIDLFGGSAPVAVKLVRPDSGMPGLRDRFHSEVQALQLLAGHRSVVRMLAYGDADGQPYLVMEHLDQSLHAWLEKHRRSGQPPDRATVYRLFHQICEALATAHHLRDPGPITHRDINPQNVMLVCNLAGEWVAKLLDFGVAKVGARSITWTGEQIGTPGYMPPEQKCSAASPPCPASDVYGLGLLLAEMLTLYQPGCEEAVHDGFAVILRDPLTDRMDRLRHLRPDVAEPMWSVIARCLQPDSGARYADAAELAHAFEQAMAAPDSAPAVVQPTMKVLLPAAALASAPTQLLSSQPEGAYHSHPTLPGVIVRTPDEPHRPRGVLRRFLRWLGRRRRSELRTVVLPQQSSWISEEPTAILGPSTARDGETAVTEPGRSSDGR